MKKIILILSLLTTVQIKCFSNQPLSKIQAGLLAIKSRLYNQASKNQALQDAITQRDYTLINYWFEHGANVSQAIKDLALEQAVRRAGTYAVVCNTDSEVIFWKSKNAVLSQKFKDAELGEAAINFDTYAMQYWLTQEAVLTQDLKNRCLKAGILKLSTEQIRFWLNYKADFFTACADLLTVNQNGQQILRVPKSNKHTNTNDSLWFLNFTDSIIESYASRRQAREVKNLLRAYGINNIDVLV